jgi:simple sugar transport system permease protein
MNKTTLGYELKACGHNKNAAKYAGMNEKRNIMLSMAIAGGLAAIGASLYYLNGGAELAWNTYGKLPDNGFNGIPVALLASNNPLGVIFSSAFLRFIDKGGYNLAGFTAYNEYVSDLIIAVIIYFAGFSKLIKDLLSRRKAPKIKVGMEATEQDTAKQAEKEEENK